MYFGSRERFGYIDCSACHSLFIENIPSDLDRHYPNAYGAHRSPVASPKRVSGPRQWARILRTEARLGRLGSTVERWVSERYRGLSPYPWRWMRMAGIGRRSAILDVGCGNGSLLRAMHAEGFDNLHGVDLFYPAETKMPGLVIRTGDVFDVQGRFDLVMLHHSLEHMPEPFEVLRQAMKLLRPGGRLLVRVPLADCVAHREYGDDWYQIDAPRHLAVPSVHGMFALAERVGLVPLALDFDSSEAQFEKSEGYRNDIPLVEQRRNARVEPTADSGGSLRDWRERAEALNKMHLGDMAAFLFAAKP